MAKRTTDYLIYRHGFNAANQPLTQSMAIAIVEASSQRHAIEIAELHHTVYRNQHLTAVPKSKAKDSDWNWVLEQESMLQSYNYKCPFDEVYGATK